MKNIASYKTILFDCDGVILNSNKIKTRAFKLASIPFGKEASNTLEDYHLRHGGISRYEKFDYFLTSIVQIKCKEKKDLYFYLEVQEFLGFILQLNSYPKVIM